MVENFLSKKIEENFLSKIDWEEGAWRCGGCGVVG